MAIRSPVRTFLGLALSLLVAACDLSVADLDDASVATDVLPPIPADPQNGTTVPATDPPVILSPPPPSFPTVGPDRQPPIIALALPADDDSHTGVMPLVADASDNVGITSVQFLVDDRVLQPPDTEAPYWLQFDTSYLSDGNHVVSAIAFDAAGNRATAQSRNVSVGNSCKTASPVLTPWQNTAFAAQVGVFTVEFDVTPYESGVSAAVGLSQGNVAAFDALTTAVRFDTRNLIQVRNGDVYAALVEMPYELNRTYRVRMDVNPADRIYSVYVTPRGGATQQLALDFVFGAAAATSFDTWVVGTEQGALRVCNVSIADNATPVANAGADQSAVEGVRVSLDGGTSVDPDGTITAYAWRQIAGPPVELSGATSVFPSFTAPLVDTDAILSFQLTVSDNRNATANDIVDVTVTSMTPGNIAPIANAGPDQVAGNGQVVTLSGAGSDSDGVVVSFVWTQIAGPPVNLTSSGSGVATFIAPRVNEDTVLSFRLTVTDNDNGTASDRTNVRVTAPD